MELRHLKYFLAVARELNFTRAAQRVRVAQPALSRQIRNLEHELGVTLLERNPHWVRLTAAGRAFQTEAESVLQRAAEAAETARAFGKGERGELPIGYAPSLTIELLPPALRAFQAAAPRVQVLLHDLATDEMLAGLRAGRLHLALLAQPAARALGRLTFTPLRTYPLCVAVARAHPLARQRQTGLARLLEESLVAYARGPYDEYHQRLEVLFQPLGAMPRMVEEHDSVMSLIAAVEAGHGVAIVPSCLGFMAGKRIKLLPLQPEPPPIVVGAVYDPRLAGEPALARFLTMLQKLA